MNKQLNLLDTLNIMSFVIGLMNLDENLTLEKAGIMDKCYIFVYKRN